MRILRTPPTDVPRPQGKGIVKAPRTLLAGIAALTLAFVPATQVMSAFGAGPSASTSSLAAPAAAPSDNASSANQAASWIIRRWNDSKSNDFSTPGMVADGIIALSSVDSDNSDNTRIIPLMLDKLKTLAPSYVGDGTKLHGASLAKVIMALDMANQNAAAFLGCDRDLIGDLLADVKANGESITGYWGPFLTAIALGRTGQTIPQSVIDAALARQTHQGKDNGAFGSSFGASGFTASPDDTGIGISAMFTVTKSPQATSEQKNAAQASIDAAIEWANTHVETEGVNGNYYWKTFSPANSTGMLASAIAETGRSVEKPAAFLRSQQLSAGAWSSSLNGTEPNAMATVQAVMGVTGRGYATAKASHMTNQVAACKPPVITTQPKPVTVKAGAHSASITVVATPWSTYQWSKLVDGVWTPIKGATSAVLTLVDLTAADNGNQYRVTVTNSAGSVNSAAITLTVGSTSEPSSTATLTSTSKPTGSVEASSLESADSSGRGKTLRPTSSVSASALLAPTGSGPTSSAPMSGATSIPRGLPQTGDAAAGAMGVLLLIAAGGAGIVGARRMRIKK